MTPFWLSTPRPVSFLEANNKAGEMLCVPEQQLVGKSESQFYPTEGDQSRPESDPQFLTPHAEGRARSRELKLLRADGTTVPVEVSASATELGGRPAVLGIFRDIRDRLEAAAILRRSEERFGYLIQNLSDVITIVDVDGTMLYYSPSIERVAGYQPAELLGRSLLAFVHSEDEPAVRAALERVTLKVGSVAPPEYRFRRKDGSWVWLESVGNNLLMVIRGYAEIVLEEDSASPAVRKSIETIVRTTESAAGLTRQLLSFSRKHVFSPQVLDLNSLVNQLSEMLLGVLRDEMEFVVKLDSDACCISADPGQIEQVIMNLVVNARDAMPHGGKLTLETALIATDASRARRPSGLPQGDFVMLAVTDTGVGMDHDTQSRIFEPFFTTKKKDEGTGLGLSVVYNIVRSSGGLVRVSSEPGRGSTLRIFFPRVAAPPQAEPIEILAKTARTGRETILVAEDQPDLRWMICQFLQERGYSVLEAKDGGDAVALAEQYKGTIDVLLTDVVMPHNRGSEVARRLSASRPNLKVIFMSGYTESEFGAVPDENLGSGVLLQKPFDLDFLALKIREVLQAPSRQ